MRRRQVLLAALAGGLAATGGCTGDTGGRGSQVERSYRPTKGGEPSAPSTVTSIMADASATVSFYAPSSEGLDTITDYVITPYVSGSAQTATTVPVGDLTSLSDSCGSTALQATLSGLTNGTAYTFTVKARNSHGDSAECDASGENTPLPGLVFGDDFNGPTGAAPDPEWWVYDRCGYLDQNEVQWYKPSHCVLDGAGSLQLTAEEIDTRGSRYPSDPNYPGTITQPWRSGACQGNTRLFAPSSGNTMTFEARFRVNPNAGSGYWPGFFWLEGQDYLTAWKKDPHQAGWNSTGKAEIDVAEWYQTGSPDSYGNVSWAGTSEQHNVTAPGLSTSFHTYSVQWKPGVSVDFYRDAALTYSASSEIPAPGTQFFLLLYMQMLAGAPTTSEQAFVDYVRVYDQNLG